MTHSPAPLAGELAPLSPRQREIAELIADGFTNKAIAAKLCIAHGTLRNHVRQIAARLNLDRTRDTRVQVTWLVIDARFDAEDARPQRAA